MTGRRSEFRWDSAQSSVDGVLPAVFFLGSSGFTTPKGRKFNSVCLNDRSPATSVPLLLIHSPYRDYRPGKGRKTGVTLGLVYWVVITLLPSGCVDDVKSAALFNWYLLFKFCGGIVLRPPATASNSSSLISADTCKSSSVNSQPHSAPSAISDSASISSPICAWILHYLLLDWESYLDSLCSWCSPSRCLKVILH